MYALRCGGHVVCGVLGSLFLDGGISIADRVFGAVLFRDSTQLLHVWTELPRHPLQVSAGPVVLDIGDESVPLQLARWWFLWPAISNAEHTRTHTFNNPFSGTTRVSRYQKGKTNLDFAEARDSEWHWHTLGHMQVCT